MEKKKKAFPYKKRAFEFWMFRPFRMRERETDRQTETERERCMIAIATPSNTHT